MKNRFTKYISLILISFTIPIQTKISIPTSVSSFFTRNKEEIVRQEFNNISKLEINCDGPVTIGTWKQPGLVLVELKKRGNPQFLESASLKTEKQERDLFVSTQIKDTNASGSLSLHILVPKDLPIKVTTTHGSITIEKASGTLELQTVRGNIAITEGTNTVIAKTVEGNIKVTRKKMQFDHALNLHSQHGNITLNIPQDVNAQLEAHSQHGKIYSDLFVTLHPQTLKLHEETFKAMRHHVHGFIGQQLQNNNPATILLSADFGVIKINGYDSSKKKK